ncbi:MAG: GNAT family N-acetyltransferase [Clostridia bacterium]|nr:GNAT family N-acetyltransferase [Clostridia bacterium]
MEYKISVLKDPARIPELIELFRTGLGDTTEAFWKWRLFTDNGQQDQPFAVILEDESGFMAGVTSVLPVLYGEGESARKCIQFCDWVVHPDHRGRGLIKMAYEYAWTYFLDRGYDFIMEFPNDNSYPIFQKYGFHEEPHINCWNSRKHMFISKKAPRDFRINDMEIRFSKECPITGAIFSRDDRICRTPAYMKWKYDGNPETEYHWATIWKKENCTGYVVYTLTKGRLRTAVNVYDWEYPYADSHILREILHKIGKQGNYVSIWGRYSKTEENLLEQCGLRRSMCSTRLMLKALSAKGWPEPLTLTRIDTDY